MLACAGGEANGENRTRDCKSIPAGIDGLAQCVVRSVNTAGYRVDVDFGRLKSSKVYASPVQTAAHNRLGRCPKPRQAPLDLPNNGQDRGGGASCARPQTRYKSGAGDPSAARSIARLPGTGLVPVMKTT
jgi:hypothetical protein